MLSPCVKPILRLPCVTTFDRAVGIGKPPLLSLAPALLLSALSGCWCCGRKRNVEVAFHELEVGCEVSEEGVDGG